MKETLTQYVNEQNIKAEAWMKACPEGQFRMAAIYDAKDIEDAEKYHGVTTPAEWDALRAWEDYYDLYKDEHGISPRWTKWSDNTAEGWEREIKEL